MYEEEKTYYCPNCGTRLNRRYNYDINGRYEEFYCGSCGYDPIKAPQKPRKKFSKKR